MGVQRDPDAGMPQPLGDDLRVNTRLEELGGMAVTQVMERDARKVRLSHQEPELRREDVGAPGRAVRPGDHESLILVRRPQEKPLFSLLPLVPHQSLHGEARQCDPAPAPDRLRLLERQSTRRLLQRTVDG